MLRKEFVDTMKDIEDAQRIIAFVTDILDKLTTDYALPERKLKFDFDQIQTAHQAHTQTLKDIPAAHRYDDLSLPVVAGLTNDQLKELFMARSKLRNAAEVALRHLNYILENKANAAAASMSDASIELTRERKEIDLLKSENDAISAAKAVIKKAAVDPDKLHETLQQKIVEKIQEANVASAEIATKLNAREITLEEALVRLNSIQESGLNAIKEVYGEHIEYANNDNTAASIAALTKKIAELKATAQDAAKALDAGLIEELKTELQPLAAQATEIQQQLSAGTINVETATEQLDGVLLQGEQKYQDFIKAKKPVTNLHDELQAFQTAAGQIRDGMTLGSIIQILAESTAVQKSLLEQYNNSKPKFVAGSADPIANFEAHAKACNDALQPLLKQCEENAESTFKKLEILGAKKLSENTAKAEVDAFVDARKGLAQAANEITYINTFIKLFNQIKVVTEAINKEKLAPGAKEPSTLSADLSPIRNQLGELQTLVRQLQDNVAAMPETDLNKELKLSVTAIANELSDTAVAFTKLDDLAASQLKLNLVASETLAAVFEMKAKLGSIKDNEVELKKMRDALNTYATNYQVELQTFIRAHCPESTNVADFMNKNVSAKTREVINSCTEACSSLKKDVDDSLEIAMKDKPAGLIDEFNKAIELIRGIKPTDIESAKTAEKLLHDVADDIKKKYKAAKPSDQKAAGKAGNDFRDALIALEKEISAVYKQHALQVLKAARDHLKAYSPSHYRKSEDRDSALESLDAFDDRLMDQLVEVSDTTLEDPEVKREHDAYNNELNNLKGRLADLNFEELPKSDSTATAFIIAMKDYIVRQHKDMKVDDLAELKARLKQLEDDAAYFINNLGKSTRKLTPEENVAFKELENEYTKIKKKLKDNIERLTPAVVTPGAAAPVTPVVYEPGTKEAIAASRARLSRAEELFNLTHAIYLNAENNPILRAKLYKENAGLGLSFNDLELRDDAVVAARAEVEAQIRISKGDKIDLAPLKKATDDTHEAAEKAENARREFSRTAAGTASGITAEEQFAMFKKQMQPGYIDHCIRTLNELEQKARLLSESAYNEEHVTKIELQAKQIRKDLRDYDELLKNIANDRTAKTKIYNKDHNWPDAKKWMEDTAKLASLTRPSSHRPPVHNNLFTSIQELVEEARTNYATKQPEKFAHFAVRAKVYSSTDKNAKKNLENDITSWIGTQPTVKPENVAFGFGSSRQYTGKFEVRLSMCQIEVKPPLLEREANQLKYAVAEEIPEDKSYYKATFYAKDIAQLARVPDPKRWLMIYESLMRGLATGVKPDLRIPTFPKNMHSLEIDFKAVAVAYGLLDINTFYDSEKSEIDKRLKKIESAAAKNAELPPTLKRATVTDAAINSTTASTRLIPGRK